MSSDDLYLVGRVWYARVLGPDGKKIRVTTKCTDKKAALAVKRRLEREHADPTHRAANETTITSALERWLNERRDRGRAEGTLDSYTNKARHLVRVFGESARLAGVTAQAVDKYIETRRAEGAHASTIGKELTVLRGTLKFAKRRREWGGDVEAVMPIGWSAQYEPRTRFLSVEEAPKLLAAFPAYRAAQLAFIIATGARDSEAQRAQRCDVDWTSREVFIRGSKTKRSRANVPILGLVEALLRFAFEHAPGKEPEGLLFAPWSGIRWDLRRVCDRLGMPRVSPNDLRRTLATWLRQRGVQTDHLGKMLRHGDSRMVERVYGQLAAGDLGRLLESRVGGMSIFSSELVETAGSVGSPGDAASVVQPEVLVPRDGIEPPTRGFSRPVRERARRPESGWNPSFARGSVSNLSSEGRERAAELSLEVRAGRAIRHGVKKALEGNVAATLQAMHRAGKALGLVKVALPKALLEMG
jgi:integrase